MPTKPIGITDDNKLASRVLRAIADSDELSTTYGEQLATPGTPAHEAAGDLVARAGWGLSALGVGEHYVPVFDHTGTPSQNGNRSTSANTFGNYWLTHKIIGSRGFRGVRLLFANWQANTNSGEVEEPNAITVRAAIHNPASGIRNRVFFGGQPEVTIGRGGHVWSDLIAISDLGSLAELQSNTRVTAVGGGTYPYTHYINSALRTAERGKESAIDEDFTMVGTPGTGMNGRAYGPIMILAVTDQWTPVVATVGDSIAMGINGADTADVQYNSFIIQACKDAGIPVASMANQGDRCQDWLIANKSARRRAFVPGATDVVFEFGINDFYLGARSFAQFAPDAIKAWRELSTPVNRVWATTVTPYATSTDSWATTANQTVHASNAARVAYNDWLRDGAPVNGSTFAPVTVGTSPVGTVRAGQAGHPLAGYFEVADIVEPSRNAGIWKAGYTLDGIHPKASAHTLMKAGIDTSRFATPPRP